MLALLASSLAMAAPVALPSTPHNSTALRLGAATENPTHYGPVGEVGGHCKDDETEQGWNDPAGRINLCTKMGCNQDSDCPTDKPANTKATVKCDARGQHSCYLSCSNADDCPLGGICKYGVCAFQASTDCYYIKNVRGSWVSISSSSGKQHVSYQEGITRSHTVSHSSEWGGSATIKASAGFNFFGEKGSVEVSGTASHSISDSYSSTFSMTTTTTYSYDFDAGVVWQWKFDIDDGCGATTASGHDLALTLNQVNPPCCLPGMFADPTKPTGACATGTPDICTSK